MLLSRKLREIRMVDELIKRAGHVFLDYSSAICQAPQHNLCRDVPFLQQRVDIHILIAL